MFKTAVPPLTFCGRSNMAAAQVEVLRVASGGERRLSGAVTAVWKHEMCEIRLQTSPVEIKMYEFSFCLIPRATLQHLILNCKLHYIHVEVKETGHFVPTNMSWHLIKYLYYTAGMCLKVCLKISGSVAPKTSWSLVKNIQFHCNRHSWEMCWSLINLLLLSPGIYLEFLPTTLSFVLKSHQKNLKEMSRLLIKMIWFCCCERVLTSGQTNPVFLPQTAERTFVFSFVGRFLIRFIRMIFFINNKLLTLVGNMNLREDELWKESGATRRTNNEPEDSISCLIIKEPSVRKQTGPPMDRQAVSVRSNQNPPAVCRHLPGDTWTVPAYI